MNGIFSLIGIILNWSGTALALALYAGAWAGLLAGIVLVINVVFRRWLSARQMGLLWCLVLLRLALPIAPASSLSLQNLLPSTETKTYQVVTEGDGGVTLSEPAAAPAVAADSGSSVVLASVYRLPTAREVAEVCGDPLFTVDVPFTMPDLTEAAIILVWLAGGAASLISVAIGSWCLFRRLQQVPVCEDQRLRSLWDECCRQAGVRRSIPILLFDGVQQLAILGLFRSRLLLPPDATELDNQQLRMVMLHELAHVRHWDIAANWLLLVMRAIHWWNPVYWLAATRFQSLREQACDAFAIRRIEGQSTRSYSELLLTLAARRPLGVRWQVSLPASVLGFLSSFFRKRAIRNRLKALRSAAVTRSRWHTAAIAALICLLAVCGLTDASLPETPPDNPHEWLPVASQAPAWTYVNKSDPGEEAGLAQISVEPQFITSDKDLAASAGVSWEHLEAFSTDRAAGLKSETRTGTPIVRAGAAVDEYFPIATATLDSQAALAITNAASQEKSATVLHSPRVTLFDGQRAQLVISTECPFVVGIQDPSDGVPEGKLTVTDEGIKLTLYAAQTRNAGIARLEGRVELSEVSDVQAATAVLRGESRTIQIPRVKRRSIEITSEMRDGDSLLIGCIPTYEQKKFFYVLLTVRRIRPSVEATK